MKWLKFFLVIVTISVRAQVVADFSLPNVVDGKTIHLRDYLKHAGVVVIFVSYDCPFDKYYMDRILKIAETYKTTFPVVLINSNSDEVESGELLKNYLVQQKITIPYLLDKNQIELKTFNAHKTPECFVLKNTGQKFTVVYRGAIDDSPQSAADVREAYLTDAIEKVLAGQRIEVAEHRPPGCSIR
ncbi:MAG: redoxin domain-containing protein [Flammeovirgaceae bacterium]|nr:MAG: redoxin domain-containing protein [Flammeovirgaceae bacterium]